MHGSSMPSTRIAALRRWLGPPRCALCQSYPAAEAAAPLCAGCAEDLPWRGESITVQSLSIQVAFDYAWPIDRVIHRYKYQGKLEMMPILAAGLRRLVRPDVDALLAVPLAPSRLRERGFNQSHELAKQLSKYWDIPLLTGIERRRGVQQQGLKRSERLLNLQGAFSVSAGMVLPRRVALLDDVLTTGSTLLHLGDLLREHGVAEVSALVVASSKRG